MEPHYGKTIWFTGLPGSGKSTLSSILHQIFRSRRIPVALLDGDVLRAGLNRDLGFSALDRAENVRRAGETAKLMSDEGHTVLAAFITPLESLRRAVKGLFEAERFVEVFLDCPLPICEARDPKGLYSRARKGEIRDFTGVSAPYEPPQGPDLTVPTGSQTVDESVSSILRYLEDRFPDLASPSLRGERSAHLDKRVVVLGLDCVPPSLVFGDAGKDLHNLRTLTEHGWWGPLKSTEPPITIPAWTTITTGRDPGELGLYGFRNRPDHGYGEMVTANASQVNAPRVWDFLDHRGLSSILLGIPQTYPPPRRGGITVSGFPVPENNSGFTHPPEIQEELVRIGGGEYLPDVKEFRTREKERLLEDLFTMVERRFRVARDFLVHRSWDFFMMVEIATDRLHHGFWRYFAKDHRLYEPGNPFEQTIPEFYKYLDTWIGNLIAVLRDNTTIIVVSDHGVRNMDGAVCINEWLMENGYLVLNSRPESERPLTPDMVDWTRTTAWGESGYYGRIFLNVKGREPMGAIPPERYQSFREDLADRLKSISDENGNPMANRILKPQEIYRSCNNVPPDLIVYFDGLSRRAIGTVGGGRILRFENNTGPDDANHDHEGIFIMTRLSDLRSGRKKGTYVETAECLDITPTALHEFNLTIPASLSGKILGLETSDQPLGYPDTVKGYPARTLRAAQTYDPEGAAVVGYTSEEEEMVKKRLMDLGYI